MANSFKSSFILLFQSAPYRYTRRWSAGLPFIGCEATPYRYKPLQTFNLISRHKGTKFPQEPGARKLRIHVWGKDPETGGSVNRLFAHGTIFPIFGQRELFSVPHFGCKLLNSIGLHEVREGRRRAIFQVNKDYGYPKTIERTR
jgi:hypothetical protein